MKLSRNIALLVAVAIPPLANAQAPEPNIVFVHPPPYVVTQPQPNVAVQQPGAPGNNTDRIQGSFRGPDGTTVLLSNPNAAAPPKGTYDPAYPSARGSSQRRATVGDSGASKAINKINPGDINYGGLLAQWRIAVVQETIESFYWWIIVSLGLGLAFSFLYIAYLLREREARLNITADNFAQLWNDLIHARREALKAIEFHNQWVAEIDRKYEVPALAESATSADAPAPAAALLTEGEQSSHEVDPLRSRQRFGQAGTATDPVSDDATFPGDPQFSNTEISEAAANATVQTPTAISAAIVEARQKQGYANPLPTASLKTARPVPVKMPEPPPPADPNAGSDPQEQSVENLQKMVRAREDKIGNQREVIRKQHDELTTLRARLASLEGQRPSGGVQ